MEQSFRLNTIERVIAVMSYLASAGSPKRLTEIAKQLKLSKASTYRILHSLESGNWVYCDPDTDMYRIGYKVLELGLTLLSNTPIASISMRYLTQLRNLTGETATLSIRIGNERIFLQEMQSGHDLRFATPLGRRLPLWSGAGGKVILANMKEEEISEIIEKLKQAKKLSFATGETIDINMLIKELDTIKKQGYAFSYGERELGSSAVAAPIFSNNGEVVGAVSVSGPSERFNKDAMKKCFKLVIEASENISKQMGAAIGHQLISC